MESLIKQEISDNLKSEFGEQLISSISNIESGFSLELTNDSISNSKTNIYK